MQRELRKYENSLSVSGLVVILFGLWSVLKLGLRLVFSTLGLMNTAEDTIVDPEIQKGFLYLAIAILAVLILELGLRLYIGLTARAESRGKKKTVVYLIIAVLLAAYSVYSLVALIRSFAAVDFFESLVSVLVELSGLFALAELIFSAIKVKQIRKKMEEEAEHE